MLFRSFFRGTLLQPVPPGASITSKLHVVKNARGRPGALLPAREGSPVSSLTEKLESDSYAVVKELLIFNPELVSAPGSAMEELDDHRRRSMWRGVHPCRRSDVYQAVEIVIGHIVEQLAYL